MLRRDARLSSAFLLVLVAWGGAHAAWAAPSAVDALMAQAEVARAAGRLAEADSTYRRAQNAAPTDPRPARAACAVARERVARGEKAVASREPCRRAVVLSGSDVEDMRNEVDAIMSSDRTPTMDDLAFAALAIEAAIRKAPDQPWGYLARCDVGRRLGSAEVLESCLGNLNRVSRAIPRRSDSSGCCRRGMRRLGSGSAARCCCSSSSGRCCTPSVTGGHRRALPVTSETPGRASC